MYAKKPIFYCNGADGLKGAYITKVRDSVDNFQDIVETLEQVIDHDF